MCVHGCVCVRTCANVCACVCVCDEKVVAFTKVRLQSIIPTSGCECLLVSEGEQNRQTLSLTDQLLLDLLTTSWKINTFQFEFKKNYSFAPRSHGVGLMKYSASTEGENPSEKPSADRGEMLDLWIIQVYGDERSSSNGRVSRFLFRDTNAVQLYVSGV